VKNFVIASVAIVVSVFVAGFVCQALGFGQDPAQRGTCYGARC
jgi:hypothetical protein